jgi:glycerophosphoryl diester phosphodiesterase
MGVQMVEFDVKLTKDNVPIIFHDDTLERTTNGSGLVAEMTLEEIKALDAGSWFSAGLADSFMGTGVPTLEEALEVIIERGLGINLEIKPCPGREVETAEAALDVLSQYWDDHNNLLISSFSEVSLETAAHIAPGWARGYLIDDIPENWRDMARHLGATTININGNNPQVTRSLIEEMIQEGYRICAYTINDPERGDLLLSWGVDALFTDLPDILEDIVPSSH